MNYLVKTRRPCSSTSRSDLTPVRVDCILTRPDRFSRGPVWVYVLERRRAVEVWLSLMGDRDPAVARETTPTSLRAIYGTTLAENAFIGAPDTNKAEEQIAALFASSPPFPPVGFSNDEAEISNQMLDEDRTPLFVQEIRDKLNTLSVDGNGQVKSTSSSLLEQSRSGDGSVGTNGTRTDPDRRRTVFKARPVPTTNAVPSIQPRTTRAAALRAGVAIETSKGPRRPPTKEEQKQTFMDVPGHKRSQTIQVASTAPPTIAPRMSRAASLRMGQPQPAKPRQSIAPSASQKDKTLKATQTPLKPATGNTFDGVPGHKRHETITVASVKPPTVAPRINRSAALRATKDSAAPPTSCA